MAPEMQGKGDYSPRIGAPSRQFVGNLVQENLIFND